MSERVIVMVSDLDDGQHGEINVFTDPKEAARLIESLLESGFEEGRIRVFNGEEMEMHVSHRPVVALVGGELENGAAPDRTQERPEEEPQAPEGDPEDVGAKAPTARAEIREEVATAPFVKDGVRFSSLFRPA